MTIRKSITVSKSPADAFRKFTDGIGKWWPLKEGFSFGGDRTLDMFLESKVGGRLYERFHDGGEYEIGRVTRCDPPNLIAFTWKVHDWDGVTEVEVRFVPAGSATRVELEHRGWEVSAKVGKERKSHDDGWDFVLEHYARRDEPVSAPK